jgi:hypothetical protein
MCGSFLLPLFDEARCYEDESSLIGMDEEKKVFVVEGKEELHVD